MFLESFTLPIGQEDHLIEERMLYNGGPNFGYIDNTYPCRLFEERELSEIWFRRITIFYGGNGSGKSTLLNLIAEKLGLERTAPFNSSELFDAYAQACRYTLASDDEGKPCQIPQGSRIITSDDVFDYMLSIRTNNQEIAEEIERGREEYARLKYGRTVKFNSMDDYEQLRDQLHARSRSVSRRRFIRETAGKEMHLISNGETTLRYFDARLEPDTLYCLDEPENSMSPAMQLELKSILEKLAGCCGSQMIIATHSPFLLSIKDARIYDLDSSPVEVRNWWELENIRLYYRFFKDHQDLFD